MDASPAGRSIPGQLAIYILAILIVVACGAAPATAQTPSAPAPVVHPRLLFDPSDIPALNARISDGGPDDAAWGFIALTTQFVYANATLDELLDNDFGLEAVPNLGVHAQLTGSPNSHNLGKTLVQYIADGWDVNSDAYSSSLRLRALALGYDLFYDGWTEPERTALRDEIISYVNYMLSSNNYLIWQYRPYLSNQTAMLAASLGLAAIALDGDADPALVSAALAEADLLVSKWLQYQVDASGSYREGVLYAAWSLRHLIYYFHARQRYDGYDYSTEPKLRLMETWFVYELDPTGGGRVNNINDCTASDHPLPRHSTFFDWAQSVWGSNLSSYIWEHTSGVYGFDMGDKADKLGTVLWNQNLPTIQPESVLPKAALWEGRGLFYYRSGWPTGLQSDDVCFSFFSGKFQGGHGQEDKNQFSLIAYGERLIVDHGPGSTARQGEAHNIIFVDGKGQHNAGNSIGTDGRITEYLLGDFGSYVMGDATAAYTTYSPLNAADNPFAGTDWSWGYTGANPVEFAHRRVVTIAEPGAPPYFLILDDIKKDDTVRDYEWRLHTDEGNTVDVSANPMRIQGSDAYLQLHVLRPNFSNTTRSVSFFDNNGADPNSNYISMNTSAVNPRFVTLLVPGSNVAAEPMIQTSVTGVLNITTLNWGDGIFDVVVLNDNAGLASEAARQENSSRKPDGPALPELAGSGLDTDARALVFRLVDGALTGYMMVDGTVFQWSGTYYVQISNGPVSISLSGGIVRLNSYSADFQLLSEGINAVYYRKSQVSTIEVNGFLYRNPASGIGDEVPVATRGLTVSTFPNPFNPVTTVSIEITSRRLVTAIVYDMRGRRVRTLWNDVLPAGRRLLEWDGRDDAGTRVASGVYLLRVQAGDDTQVRKLTMIK